MNNNKRQKIGNNILIAVRSKIESDINAMCVNIRPLNKNTRDGIQAYKNIISVIDNNTDNIQKQVETAVLSSNFFHIPTRLVYDHMWLYRYVLSSCNIDKQLMNQLKRVGMDQQFCDNMNQQFCDSYMLLLYDKQQAIAENTYHYTYMKLLKHVLIGIIPIISAIIGWTLKK